MGLKGGRLRWGAAGLGGGGGCGDTGVLNHGIKGKGHYQELRLWRSPVRVFCSLCLLFALSSKPLKEMMMSSKRGRLEASSLQQS